MLRGLPNLVSLDLSCSGDVEDEQLVGLQGLTGLEALTLRQVRRITVSGMQALLPMMGLLTSL